MGKALNLMIVVIVIIAIIGGVSAYFLLDGFSKEDTKDPPPPPPPNKQPIAFFKGNSTGTVGELLWFDGNGSRDPDGIIKYFIWDFGDLGTWEDENSSLVNHTYNAAGIFSVNLTVRDDGGGKDSYELDVTIRPNDYLDSGNEILLERVGNSNMSKEFPIEEFAVSLEINISFQGASKNGMQIGDTTLEVTIYNSIGEIIGNITKDTKVQQEYIDFYYFENDLTLTGKYTLEATCLKGVLNFNYSIEVRY